MHNFLSLSHTRTHTHTYMHTPFTFIPQQQLPGTHLRFYDDEFIETPPGDAPEENTLGPKQGKGVLDTVPEEEEAVEEGFVPPELRESEAGPTLAKYWHQR